MLLVLGVAIIGALFKILHWPGANILLILGLSWLAIVSFIRSAYVQERSTQGYLNGLSNALMIIGVLFKMMHWPHAMMMLYIGIALWVVSLLVGYNKK
jgi:uncharacterized membrane protein